MKNVIERTAYLESLGFTDVEYEACPGDTTEYYFEWYGMMCSIESVRFEIGDSASQIMSAATFYSCCGDVLNKDSMMCPSCKEHC